MKWSTLPLCPQTGKVQFKTQRMAVRYGKRMTNDMRAYRCAYCHAFHLTGQSRRAA